MYLFTNQRINTWDLCVVLRGYMDKDKQYRKGDFDKYEFLYI